MKKIKRIFALILALNLVLGLPLTVGAADTSLTYIPLTADGTDTAAVTVDGNFSTAEWGQPVGAWTASELTQVDGSQSMWKIWNPGAGTTGQSVEVYVKRNNERLMLAFRLVNAHHLDKGYTGTDGWRYANMRFVVADYDYANNANAGTFTYNSKTFEKFAGWRVQQQWNESTQTFTKSCSASAPGKTPAKLNASDYAIGWDEATKTYTYEFSIAWSQMYGYVSAHKDLMLGAEISDARVDGYGYGNRWFLSDAAHGNMETNSSGGMVGFSQGMPMRITFDDGSYHNTVANPMPTTAPTIDGRISQTEWGTPTMVVSPNYTLDTWADTYQFFSEASQLDVDKKGKVWLTNDSDYIYVAATLDHEVPASPDSSSSAWRPTLGLMLAAQGGDTDLVQFDYNTTTYEKFTQWTLSINTEGTPSLYVKAPGFDVVPKLGEDDWEIVYDADTDTLIYEVRIPFNHTNINPLTSQNIAMSVYLASYHHGASGGHNRMCIGGAGYANYPNHGQTPYQDRCLKMTLNTVETAAQRLERGEDVTLVYSQNLIDTPVVINDGATLDLNGYALTANFVRATAGSIVDSSNGAGSIIIAKNDLNDDTHLLEVAPDNATLPLYDTDRYRFYSYEINHQNKTVDASAKFGIQLTFNADKAYALLADKDSADIDLTITLSSPALSQDIPYTFRADTLADYAAKKQSGDGKNWTIVLTVSGLESLSIGQTLTANPALTSSTGANPTGAALTFIRPFYPSDLNGTYTFLSSNEGQIVKCAISIQDEQIDISTGYYDLWDNYLADADEMTPEAAEELWEQYLADGSAVVIDDVRYVCGKGLGTVGTINTATETSIDFSAPDPEDDQIKDFTLSFTFDAAAGTLMLTEDTTGLLQTDTVYTRK